MVSRAGAPELAISDASPGALIHCAEESEESEGFETCEHWDLRVDSEVAVGRGDQVLITSSGNYVVAIHNDSRDQLWFRVGDEGIEDRGKNSFVSEDSVVQLVASLRSSDWVIARDLHRRLRRLYPGEQTADLIAPGIDGLRLVAVGESHIIGRERLGDGSEAVWLVPVDRDLPHASAGPVLLMRGPASTRVALTSGDARVVVTTGTGGDAETFVFGVPDGALLDRFAGGMVSGRGEHDSVPGLSATAPDGSHVAYRTGSGALALRDLENATSCLIRSANGGDHQVGGFSAQGLLYMEARDRNTSSVLAWNGRTRQLASLASFDDDFHLAAVPAADATDGVRPWAFGVHDGAYAGLQAGAAPETVTMGRPVFIPREGTRMSIATLSDDGSGNDILDVLRVQPAIEQTGGYRFTMERVVEPRTITGSTRVCMSTANPAAAYRCGKTNDLRLTVGQGGLPSSEDPDAPIFGDEVPELSCRDTTKGCEEE
jgi:hypothetical protein